MKNKLPNILPLLPFVSILEYLSDATAENLYFTLAS
jgi:hypothetical protein